MEEMTRKLDGDVAFDSTVYVADRYECETFESTVGPLIVKQQKTSLLYGYCPDQRCNELILFDYSNNLKRISCTFCSQTHGIRKIKLSSPIGYRESLHLLHRSNSMPKRSGPEWSRVDGITPFLCKLVSPLFTRYGVDNVSGEAKLLTELDRNEIFEPKLLSDRAFMINSDDLKTPGYGTDMSGGLEYLWKTLKIIKSFNNGFSVVEPLHVNGDGNCLVHAVSRCLIGREIYWHALKENVYRDLIKREQEYRQKLDKLVTDENWQEIINELSSPIYLPKDSQPGK